MTQSPDVGRCLLSRPPGAGRRDAPGTDVGARFVHALAGEATGSRRVLDDVLRRWFEPDDVVEEVLELRSADVAGRARVDHLLQVRTVAGAHLVQQRARLDLGAHARVVRLEAVCGGFWRVPETTAEVADGARGPPGSPGRR